MMTISNTGIDLITSFEGWSGKVYRDVKGVPTIGYGFTFYPDGRKVKITDKPITIAEGKEIMKHIVKNFEKGVNENVTSKINQNQFDALVSFSYNVGVTAFKNSTLLKKINANPADKNIELEFAKWTKSGGKVYNGLIKRRKAESALYFKK